MKSSSKVQHRVIKNYPSYSLQLALMRDQLASCVKEFGPPTARVMDEYIFEAQELPNKKDTSPVKEVLSEIDFAAVEERIMALVNEKDKPILRSEYNYLFGVHPTPTAEEIFAETLSAGLNITAISQTRAKPLGERFEFRDLKRMRKTLLGEDKMEEQKSNDFILTISGEEVYIDEIAESAFNIEDIAHSLSLQCRFNGHVTHFYSVAQHSLNLVDALFSHCEKNNIKADANFLLSALLHDAAETYTGDIVRPYKQRLQRAFFTSEDVLRRAPKAEYSLGEYVKFCNVASFEKDLDTCIRAAFGLWNLSERMSALLTEFDTNLCATESQYLCSEVMPRGHEKFVELPEEAFDYVTPSRIEMEFLTMFDDLKRQL